MMRNFDYAMPYQGKMAKSALYHAAQDATALREALQDGDAIPQWVHYKIAVAADNLAKVNRYMQYQVLRHPSGYARTNPSGGKTVARAIRGVTPERKKLVNSNQSQKRKAARLLFNLIQLDPEGTQDKLAASLSVLASGQAGSLSDPKIKSLYGATKSASLMWDRALAKAGA